MDDETIIEVMAKAHVENRFGVIDEPWHKMSDSYRQRFRDVQADVLDALRSAGYNVVHEAR